MKTILLIILLFCSVPIFCQDNDDLYFVPHKTNTPKTEKTTGIKSVPKGTWKIIIKNEKTKDDNYQFIGETLTKNDFQIYNASKDFYTISSVPKAHDRLNFNYILNFVTNDSLIILTGTFKINASIDLGMAEINFDYDKIENKGQMGSCIREAFKELYQFGLKLSNGNEMAFISDNQPPATSTPKNVTKF